MARLFLAVRPPEEVIEVLRALPRKDQRGVRFLPSENWHATLRFFGDADPDAVVEAVNRADLPAATARVGPAIDMLGSHSAMAPVHGLDELAGAVNEATHGIGTLDARPAFVGHITIARVKRGAIVRKVIGMMCACDFAVDEIELIESQLHSDGSKYTCIASWPLGS